MMNKKSQEYSRNLFFLSFSAHWWAKSYYTLGSPNGFAHNTFLQFPPKIVIFQKKLFYLKIFQYQICNKKSYIRLWRKMTHSPKKKKTLVLKTFYWPMCTNFCTVLYKNFFITPINTSYKCVISAPSVDQEQQNHRSIWLLYLILRSL